MPRRDFDLLIIKPGNQQAQYTTLAATNSAVEPPVFSAMIAAYAREKGFRVRILDAAAENFSPDDVVARVRDYAPWLVAVFVSGTNPSASTQCMPGATRIIGLIKEQVPGTRTLVGGLHPTVLPERTMRETGSDFLCQGEGFQTVVELLAAIKSGETGSFSISGLWYREDGKVVPGTAAPMMQNIDDLPLPAWDLLPMDKYRAQMWHGYYRASERTRYAAVWTSFGCPYNCSFCCINAQFGGRGIRYRDPKKVIAEIDLLVRDYGVRNIRILDEMFLLKTGHVSELCDLLIGRQYNLNIWAYARIDTINHRIMEKCKAAGINWLGLGIESASERVRTAVDKGKFDQPKIYQAIENIRAEGLYVGGNFIFGLPEDDQTSMRETLQMAKQINCEFANFYVAMPYPGSQLYEDSLRNDVTLQDNWLAYAQFSAETHPLATKYLSAREVLEFRDRAFQDYYRDAVFQESIKRKFGSESLKGIQEMLQYKLKRNLLTTPGP